MRILLTNDDGISAAQLVPLIKWCRKLGEVTVFVPKFEQSGKSHGINIQNPFEVKQVKLEADVTVWSVDSTPADCVRIAVLGFQKEFDLVISGVNRGLNMGADIMYSGTVAACSEAVNLGIKAIALSTSFEDYPRVIEQLDRIFDFINRNQLLDKGSFYNINIPADAQGIRITQQGGPYYSDDFLPIGSDLYNPKGKPVWVDGNNLALDTDATKHGFITITPMTINRTDFSLYDSLCHLRE